MVMNVRLETNITESNAFVGFQDQKMVRFL